MNYEVKARMMLSFHFSTFTLFCSAASTYVIGIVYPEWEVMTCQFVASTSSRVMKSQSFWASEHQLS